MKMRVIAKNFLAVLLVVMMICGVFVWDMPASKAAEPTSGQSAESTPEPILSPEPTPEPTVTPQPTAEAAEPTEVPTVAPEPTTEPTPESTPAITSEPPGVSVQMSSDAVTLNAMSGYYDYTVNTDGVTVTITGYHGPGGMVTIPSILDGYPVAAVGEEVFINNSTLTTVTITAGVTSIGTGAFYGCEKLADVILPTGLLQIGKFAFGYCPSLANTNIPNTVTAIDEGAFNSCSKLNSITIPSSVQYIGNNAFDSCQSLSSITIENGVKSIGTWAFRYCSKLTTITLPASVSSIEENAFSDCNNLFSIEVNTGNASFSSQSGVLYNKNKTHLLRYPEGKTGSSYTIPNSVTAIGDYAFYACYQYLASVVIPEGVTNIGEHAFDTCGLLTSITIPASVTNIGTGAFCLTSLKTILVASANACYSSVNGVLYNKGKTILVQYPIGKTDTSFAIPSGVIKVGDFAFIGSDLKNISVPNGLISIGNNAFDRCWLLTGMTLPNSVTTIGDSAFSTCASLKGVFIPEGVTVISDRAFSGCGNLTSFRIPSHVTNIGEGAFSGCDRLTTIVIPETVKSIGEYAFAYCRQLLKAYFYGDAPSIGQLVFDGCAEGFTVYYSSEKEGFSSPWYGYRAVVCVPSAMPPLPDASFTGNSANFAYWVSNGCASITEYTGSGGAVVIPSTLGGYPVTEIGQNVFSGNQSIRSVTMPIGITTIGNNAFYRCQSMTGISIPKSVATIGYGAFYGCTSITSVSIPEGVTSLGAYAFDHCVQLSSVTLPGSLKEIPANAFAYTGLSRLILSEGIKSIGSGAFSWCISLQNVTFPSTLVTISDGAFKSCTNMDRVYFKSNAPSTTDPSGISNTEEGVFKDCKAGFTIYYLWGATGFTNPWHGYPTVAAVSVNASASNLSYGTVTGNGMIARGTTATLKAVPSAGCRFVRWLDNGVVASTNSTYSFMASSNRNLKAEFARIDTPKLSASSAGTSSTRLSWTAAAGAAGYEIWRGGSKIATVSGTSYTNTGLTLGQTYSYQVKAYCKAGSVTTYGSLSNAASAKPAPAVPVASASAAAYNKATVRWNAITGASGYEVYRSTTPVGGYKRIYTASRGSVTSYSNSGLNTGVTYYYQVVAYAKSGKTTVYGGYSAAASVKCAIGSVTGAKASAYDAGSVKLSWKSVTGRTKYEIWRSTSPNSGFAVVATTTSTSYKNSGLVSNTTYYYKIRAYRTNGGVRADGGYSATVSAKPVLGSVTGAKASVYGTSSVKLSWKAVSGRTKYEIWRSTTPNSGFSLVTTTTSTSYKNSGLTPNITYYYRICVYRQCGSVKAYGGNSPTMSAKPTFGAVTGAKAVRASATSIKLSWGKVSGSKKYVVLRSTSPTGTFTVLKEVSGTKLTDSKLTTGVTYYYKVKAYCMVGSNKYYGGESAVVSAMP